MVGARCRIWLFMCALPLLLVVLTGCFVSDTPLITGDNSVTPLPSQFDYAFAAGGDSFIPPSAAVPSAGPMGMFGKSYDEEGDNPNQGGMELSFADLDKAKSTYILQVVLAKTGELVPTAQIPFYAIAKKTSGGMAIFDFPDSKSKPFLSDGVSVDPTTGNLQVDDFNHLLSAARAYDKKGLLIPAGTLFIATTPTEIAQLQSKVAAASSKQAQAPSPQATQAPAPSPPAAPAPPPTPVPAPPPTAAPSTEPTQGGVDGKTFLTWTVGVQRLYLNGAAQAYWAFQDTSRFPIHGECAEGEIRRFRHTFDSPMMSYLTNKFASEPDLDVVQSVYDYLGAHCEPVGIDFLGGPYVFTDADLLDRLTNDNYFNEGLTQANAADFLRAMVEMTSLVYVNSSYPSLAACTSNFLSEVEFSDLLDYVANSDRDQGENVVQILQDVIAQSCHEQRKNH